MRGNRSNTLDGGGASAQAQSSGQPPMSELSGLGSQAPDDQGALSLPLLMTINDFLQCFRIGRSSFYREVNCGRLKIVKFGTATRIFRSEAETWLSKLPSPPLAPSQADAASRRNPLAGPQRTRRT
jgi:hypothetical protein